MKEKKVAFALFIVLFVDQMNISFHYCLSRVERKKLLFLFIFSCVLSLNKDTMGVNKKRSNVPVAVGVCLVAATFGFLPYLIQRNHQKNHTNMFTRDKALTGSQTQRGVFLNSGTYYEVVESSFNCVTD